MQKTTFFEMSANKKRYSISGVYVFEFSSGIFKIGYSANIFNRIKNHNHERTKFNRDNISDIWFLIVDSFPKKAESQFHKILKEYRKSASEHFECSINSIIEASKKISFLYKNSPLQNMRTKQDYPIFSARTGVEMNRASQAIFDFYIDYPGPIRNVMRLIKKQMDLNGFNRNIS